MTRTPEEPEAAERGRRRERVTLPLSHRARVKEFSQNGTLLTVVTVVAVLYFVRVVFIPLALAVLFAFLLAPMVLRLRHWGLGRVPSTVIVVLFSFAAVVLIGGLVTGQGADLLRKMPEYRHNVQEKLHSVRTSGGGLVNRVTRFVHNFTEELVPAPSPTPVASNQPAEDKPVPVEIRKAPFAPMEVAQKILGSILNIVLMAGIVVVFVIFILIQREDLRDRLFRLVGAGRVNIATQALDDAAGRLSRYLLAQLMINAGFGVLATIGLYFIGVPNPILWGLVAAIMRYIPYLGIWIAAALPAAVAFAVEPGWIKMPMVFGLYFGIDLLMYNFVEPLLYGTSTGVSPMAILVAAVFWTWLWGPVGLLLATPLTVCVVVMGRYVPRLEFLSVMLSDEPVLRPATRFYQRLLAMDLEEATEVAEEFLAGKSFEQFGDELVVPALSMVEEDRHRGKLDDEREHFIFENMRFLVDDLSERADDLASKEQKQEHPKATAEIAPGKIEEPSVLCIPARDEADEIMAQMLAHLLQKRGVCAKALTAAALASECLEEVAKGQIRMACIIAVPPFGYTHARYLCRRLRGQFPELKLVAAILTERNADEIKERSPKIAADEVATSVQQALTAVLSFAPHGNGEAKEPVLSVA